jgi:hypothetical protein
VNLVAFGSESFAESVEIERVLTDARSCDATLFARKTMRKKLGVLAEREYPRLRLEAKTWGRKSSRSVRPVDGPTLSLLGKSRNSGNAETYALPPGQADQRAVVSAVSISLTRVPIFAA